VQHTKELLYRDVNQKDLMLTEQEDNVVLMLENVLMVIVLKDFTEELDVLIQVQLFTEENIKNVLLENMEEMVKEKNVVLTLINVQVVFAEKLTELADGLVLLQDTEKNTNVFINKNVKSQDNKDVAEEN